MAAQADLCLTWLQTPKTGSSRDMVHIIKDRSLFKPSILSCLLTNYAEKYRIQLTVGHGMVNGHT